MTSRRAYTLIEILIVLALLSLVLCIAVPSLGILNSVKEKQEFNELKRDLLYSKNKAITENCNYEIKINVSSNSYEIIDRGTNTKFKTKSFESGLKFVEAKDTTTDTIKFSPTGAPSSSGTFFIKRRSGDMYKFSIVPVTGKVNVYIVK